jgi:ribonucleoside-diphosphate reductase beta chain
MILQERLEFKPFEYQWAYEAWFKQQNAHWLHTEISLQKDVKDWDENLTKEEKNVVGNILKGFTQTETVVNDYWSTYVTKWFPIPEIKMMATTFGAFETIHAVAYSYLNDTLNLTDFKAFLEDESTMNKLNVLMEIDPNDKNISNIARSLALFSACAEGIQLYSSFAVLLSFRKKNMLVGIGQQMIFSIRDESLHSEMGCKLFRTLINENKHVWTDELKEIIYKGVDLAIINEINYINKIFEMGDLETINKNILTNFIYDRANRKLKELMLLPVYDVNEKLLNDMDWFYVTTAGEQQTDFFSNREVGYSKPNDDWNNIDELF